MMPTNPFQAMKQPMGPNISPASMNASGRGGQQQPPYLQMRKPMMANSNMTKPVITPKPTAMGDTVRPPVSRPGNSPPITPAAGANPPQAGGNSLGDLYGFLKSDLQNQTKQAKSSAVADASARGVYYGTPLTGSEADIDTQYLRGLGQLDSGMYGNEQQNQLARLGMATNLSAMGGANAPPVPGPMDWSGLGALFGSSPSSPTSPPVAAPRQGPAITPNGQKPNGQSSGLGITPKDPYAQGN